jgi:hypothetical protein
MVPTSGSDRNRTEIDEKWTQYSGLKDRGTIRQLPAVSHREEQELGPKALENPKNFRPEYFLHEIAGILRNQPISCRTVRPE